MREILNFNNDWLYNESFSDAHIQPQCTEESFTPIKLPHANKEIPYNYFDETSYQFISSYRKHFTVESSKKGQRLYIDFEGVMTYAKCYLNGHYIGEHKGGYTQFSFEITDYILYDEDNLLTVMVDSTERPDIPPFGFVVDYLCYGGIYREVNLRIVDQIHVDHLFLSSADVLGASPSLECQLFLSTHDEATLSHATLELIDVDGNVITSYPKDINTIPQSNLEPISFNLQVPSPINLWSIDHPYLYTVKVSLFNKTDLLDTYQSPFGFRDAKFTKNGFFLNGECINLIGVNRHQSFPYVGYAMPKRAQQKDADILKYDMGHNIVRTSHYPQSRHFLDRCDEIGLLVFEEIPGWQHIGDQAWKEVAYENVREMITRDYNHPSIIIWGVRINESKDDFDFYTDTNRIAHALDKTRQTGGVRAHNHSEFLEDVFTMNDFIYGRNDGRESRPIRRQREATGLDHNVPYLITENMGHMFPTKKFDQESRRMEHALRHMEVQSETALDDTISGSIAWCAFDYNTHCEFGSGDRICYHGIMDMFRIPKFAAYGYSSQISPKIKPVMEPITLWTVGERNGGDGRLPIVIFTNCDVIKLFVGERHVGDFTPDTYKFQGLDHPPVFMNENLGAWGASWDDGRFEGYINGNKVIEKTFTKNPITSVLNAQADDLSLSTGDWDTTRVVYRLEDQVGNVLPFTPEVLNLEIEGVGQIIGPNQTSFIGGSIAVWIKTDGCPGTITLRANTSSVEAEPITIEVVAQSL